MSSRLQALQAATTDPTEKVRAVLPRFLPLSLAPSSYSRTSFPLWQARLKAREESVSSHGDFEDIGTEDEKLLGEIVAKTHGQDFYIIDKFPAEVRPSPCHSPCWTCS